MRHNFATQLGESGPLACFCNKLRCTWILSPKSNSCKCVQPEVMLFEFAPPLISKCSERIRKVTVKQSHQISPTTCTFVVQFYYCCNMHHSRPWYIGFLAFLLLLHFHLFLRLLSDFQNCCFFFWFRIFWFRIFIFFCINSSPKLGFYWKNWSIRNNKHEE